MQQARIERSVASLPGGAHGEYLDWLGRVATELRRVMRGGATAMLVVQDNYYKDLHNDTPKILSEMAMALGFRSAQIQEFAVARNRASMNPRARQYRTKASAVESILILR